MCSTSYRYCSRAWGYTMTHLLVVITNISSQYAATKNNAKSHWVPKSSSVLGKERGYYLGLEMCSWEEAALHLKEVQLRRKTAAHRHPLPGQDLP